MGPDEQASSVRVVSVEDDPEVETLLRVLFASSSRFELVGQLRDGSDAVELASSTQADIVLLDLLMPGLDGREVLPTLVTRLPETMVAVLSALPARSEAEATFSSGAFAYLEKSLLGPRLLHELDQVYDRFRAALRGETVWVPEIRPPGQSGRIDTSPLEVDRPPTD